mgnify:CR=1 FL=1
MNIEEQIRFVISRYIWEKKQSEYNENDLLELMKLILMEQPIESAYYADVLIDELNIRKKKAKENQS